jgi:hypothetical protein
VFSFLQNRSLLGPKYSFELTQLHEVVVLRNILFFETHNNIKYMFVMGLSYVIPVNIYPDDDNIRSYNIWCTDASKQTWKKNLL